MSKDTGGPAFPFSFNVGDDHRWAHGLTLRDYFAAKAMQGFASNLGPNATFESRAKVSYQWADEMLRAREAKDD